MIKVMRRAPQISCHSGLSELWMQLTQQLAKSISGVSGSARRQANAARMTEGFTIIELMIATAVFGIILLVALAGFTSIGRLFYKGVTINQTQNITSQVLDDVVHNIQSAASVSTLQSGNGYTFYCVGGTRYTLNLKHMLDTSQPEDYSVGGNFGLIRDKLPGATACAPPCATSNGCPSGTVSFTKPVEMLSNHMRLMRLDIASANGQLYNVSVVVAFGTDSVFANVSDPDKIECQGGEAEQAFCAVNRISTGAYEGLHS